MKEKFLSSGEGDLALATSMFNFDTTNPSDWNIGDVVCLFCISRGSNGLVPNRMYFRITAKAAVNPYKPEFYNTMRIFSERIDNNSFYTDELPKLLENENLF